MAEESWVEQSKELLGTGWYSLVKWTLALWELFKNFRRRRIRRKSRKKGRVSFVRRDLQGEDFSGEDLHGFDFRYSNMKGAIFEPSEEIATDLSMADLRLCNLDEASFKKANLSYLRSQTMERKNSFLVFFGNRQAEDLTFNLTTIRNYRKLASKYHHGTLLSRCSMCSASFESADLRGAVMDVADCRRSIFNGASMQFACLRYACLGETVFREANLAGANLSNAFADGAIFESANLTGAQLTDGFYRGANFTEARMEGAEIGGHTSFENAIFTRAEDGVGSVVVPVQYGEDNEKTAWVFKKLRLVIAGRLVENLDEILSKDKVENSGAFLADTTPELWQELIRDICRKFDNKSKGDTPQDSQGT